MKSLILTIAAMLPAVALETSYVKDAYAGACDLNGQMEEGVAICDPVHHHGICDSSAGENNMHCICFHGEDRNTRAVRDWCMSQDLDVVKEALYRAELKSLQ